jgi:aspartokinase/homoserine dehydrogenase 1
MLDVLPHPMMARTVAPAMETPERSSLRVLKFGGSSLATPGRVRRAARIVDDAARSSPIVMVVSAFHGTTNALLECAQLAQHDVEAATAACEAIAARHRAAANALIGRDDRATRASVARQLRELRDVLRGITLLGCCPPAALDTVASFGERLSATIVAGYMNRFRPARFVDARDFVTTDDRFTRAAVDFTVTNRAARECFTRIWDEAPSLVPVVTGFIGRSAAGRTTTIGRNGSDYTAAIVGAALDAAAIEIWTDVDGVLTGDPKTTPSAAAIPEITYDDALEMSHAGANVLHPATIGPAIARSIPIVIKNTLNPSAAGTRNLRVAGDRVDRVALRQRHVDERTHPADSAQRRSIDRAARRPRRVTHALASRGIEVVLGSHACSELSLSAAVRDADAAAAIEAVKREFCFELERGLATLIEYRDRVVVTVVGAAGTEEAAMAGAVFGVLGRHEIPLRAFSQGRRRAASPA